MRKVFLFVACLILKAQAVDNDPEIEMNAPQIIERWGYPVEIHTVETTDGYLIDIHRIPAGKNQVQTPNKPVVFMQHGFMCDSSNWIVNLPDQSAGFIFADAGYDVWLGNVRGNTYGKKHKTLNPKSEKFWEFSFDEHAAIDLPNQIDYVLQKTGQKSLNYIGHSQGTLTMFAHLSEDQTFASKIQNFFALAPIGTMTHVEGLFGFLARNFDLELDALYLLFGSGEFLPSNNFMKVISKDFCGTNPTNDYCDNILFLISGPESTQFNDTRVAVYTSQTPAGVSTQNTIHFMQLINGAPGVVSKFDYQDPKKNQKKYGQDTPPAYDYSKVNAPTHLFWGDQDYLGDPMDIKSFLIPTLKPEFVKTNLELKNYNHMDFIWGLSTPTDVYAQILKTIKASNQGRFQRH